jgi:hypothetical protein
MKALRRSGLATGVSVLLLAAAAPALAAPVTVDLRIEGPTRTLFEGPVTTDVRTFHFTGDVERVCDGSPPAGSATSPQPTRGAALTAASDAAPFTTAGTWSATFGSPSFTQIAGEDVGYDAATQRFLVEYKNERAAMTGSCGDPISSGDRVLYAYGTGSEPLLALTGPASGRAGETVTLAVTDAATGAPIAGASVGGATTGADGRARVTLGAAGRQVFKATRDGAIRSNAVAVTIGEGAAQGGPAGQARDRLAPGARILGIRDRQVFARGRGPRTLRLAVPADPSGVLAVKLRLTRRLGGRCWYFSGRRETLRRTRCGRAFFFRTGETADARYLLPARLGPGRYVLDLAAVDRAGNRDALLRGRTRVVFTVR